MQWSDVKYKDIIWSKYKYRLWKYMALWIDHTFLHK